ncbi:BON domain-containing protein [Tundrisphaera lichenicola]|uniref:BON domain-containing protein n=1 Tax=Tundrisphaera lichenicola TaxID=2029860 RepID=UPI003EBD3798
MSSPKSSLIQQLETRVREATHNRIRNLSVEETKGHVTLRGQVPSHHTRQLALHGALELLSGDRFSAMFTVG